MVYVGPKDAFFYDLFVKASTNTNIKNKFTFYHTFDFKKVTLGNNYGAKSPAIFILKISE